MGRPRKVIRSVEKTLCIDERLVAWVELKLMSQVEGRVPFGAWKVYIEDLIRKDMKEDKTKGVDQ